MPPIEWHKKQSLERTGKDHREVHEWLDRDPARTAERHDVTKMHDNGKRVEEAFGEEALQEYIQHLDDDLKAKLTPVRQDLEKAVAETPACLAAECRGEHKNDKTEPADIAMLRSAGVAEDDIRHCVKVAEKALEIAHRVGGHLDLQLVGRGALFHDLGKARTHEIEHGKIGAEMGRKLGLSREITDIMEKHIRGGLTEGETRELGLPVKDYSLKTLEEKIVIYADRLVDIVTDPEGIVATEPEAEQRFEEILRKVPKYGKNEITLARYLGYHREIQGLVSPRQTGRPGRPG